jgi:hypothetical protein
MLDPDDRTLLLDALRPPAGTHLDAAVGTTYSLDLDALLTVPLAFALFDVDDQADDHPDPLAVLEAVRRYGDRLDLFCEAGRIAVPHRFQPVLAYLEDSLHEVVPASGMAFHPKVWLLRFTRGETPTYRLLCLSRNLTQDRSWDVLVSLDGTPSDDADVVDDVRHRNASLSAFLGHLPTIARAGLDDRRRARITALADEIASVAFTAPPSTRHPQFWAPGVADQPWWPFDGHDRALVISPFLTAGTVQQLAATGDDHVLISRAESLDELGPTAVAGYAETLVLSDDAADPEQTGAEATESTEAAPELSGLHAKVYVLEHAARTRFLAGSANATQAAFTGNVEMLVELEADTARLGIDQLLRTQPGATTLRDLLIEHRPNPDAAGETDEATERLDLVRRAITSGVLQAIYEPSDDSYTLTVRLTPSGPLDAVDVWCWPVTLARREALAVETYRDTAAVTFASVSSRGVTPFIAFSIRPAKANTPEEVFAVRAELVGGPEDRLEQVLVAMLESGDDLLRLLLLLLADADPDAGAIADLAAGDGAGGLDRIVAPRGEPLFESLLHTLADDPARLDHIQQLLADLRRTDRGAALIPEDFDRIWQPIWAARQESA